MPKAAGEAQPPPFTETGTLNSIAVSGAAPVTMQNSTEGRPRALSANRWRSVDGAGGGAVAVIEPPARSGVSHSLDHRS
jgi:hypothetical protein